MEGGSGGEFGFGFVAIVEMLGRLMEGIGVVVIVIGALLATLRFFQGARQHGGSAPRYKTFRTGVAQAILLGWSSSSPATSSAPWRWSRRSPASACWRSSC